MSSDPSASLTCRELVELVTDYFERSLSDRDRARFEEHLRGCRGCTTYLEQIRATLTALGRLSEEDVSAEAQAALLAAFRRWKSA